MGADVDKDNLTARCKALSPREADVLRRWAYQSAKEIAAEWNISENTVHGHANSARKKLGVGSTRKASRLFQEYEIMESPPKNWGDEFSRVSGEGVDASGSDSGYSKIPTMDLGSANLDITGWRPKAQIWLSRLSFSRWLALSVALILGVIAVFGLGAVSLLGIFEVLQKIGGPHR